MEFMWIPSHIEKKDNKTTDDEAADQAKLNNY